MNIRLFGNKIFAPNKCGTRYLQFIFSHQQFTHLFLPKIENECYFIIREPLEHLKSALHTELYNIVEKDDFEKKLDNFISDVGTIHYVHNLYHTIYLYKQKNLNCDIVQLSNLSNLIQTLGYNIPYNKENYDFSKEYTNYIDKDTFFNKIKEKHKNKILVLEEYVIKEQIWYNKLINNDINNIDKQII